MGKHGMKERVTKNPDPTFSEVLGIGNGFELADDLAIRDVYTKRVFRSMVPASKLAPRPKERC